MLPTLLTMDDAKLSPTALTEMGRSLLARALPEPADTDAFNRHMRTAKGRGLSWLDGFRFAVAQRKQLCQGVDFDNSGGNRLDSSSTGGGLSYLFRVVKTVDAEGIEPVTGVCRSRRNLGRSSVPHVVPLKMC